MSKLCQKKYCVQQAHLVGRVAFNLCVCLCVYVCVCVYCFFPLNFHLHTPPCILSYFWNEILMTRERFAMAVKTYPLSAPGAVSSPGLELIKDHPYCPPIYFVYILFIFFNLMRWWINVLYKVKGTVRARDWSSLFIHTPGKVQTGKMQICLLVIKKLAWGKNSVKWR